MGQEDSQELFVHLLRDTLKVRGTKEGQQQLLQFLKCIKDVCVPLVPYKRKYESRDLKRCVPMNEHALSWSVFDCYYVAVLCVHVFEKLKWYRYLSVCCCLLIFVVLEERRQAASASASCALLLDLSQDFGS